MSGSDGSRGKSGARSPGRVAAAGWLAAMGAVAALHLVPTGYDPSTPAEDKVLHGAIMLPLAASIPWRMSPARAAAALAGFVLLAGAIELAQGAMGLGRTADLLDWAGGSAGAAAGLGLRLVWDNRRRGQDQG